MSPTPKIPVTPQALDLPAKLWRNGSDSEPQLTVTLPDGSKAWLRVPRSSGKAYAACVAALEAAEHEAEAAAEMGMDIETYREREARHGDFQWQIVGHVDLTEPEAEEGSA